MLIQESTRSDSIVAFFIFYSFSTVTFATQSASKADMHEQAGVSGRYFPVPKSRSSSGDAEIDILVGAGGTLRPLIPAPPTWKVHANCRTIPSVSWRLPTTS